MFIWPKKGESFREMMASARAKPLQKVAWLGLIILVGMALAVCGYAIGFWIGFLATVVAIGMTDFGPRERKPRGPT